MQKDSNFSSSDYSYGHVTTQWEIIDVAPTLCALIG